jgi:GNAT superfamily N-acetyltransferase
MMEVRLASGSARPSCTVRVAGEGDVPEIVRVTNAAYVVERFCLQGERTDAADVRERMDGGRFLVIGHPADPATLRGSVYVSVANGRGYLGTLAVDPQCQGQGLARALVAAVEEHCRAAGCAFLDITVVNLRKELFPFYAQFGFFPSAVLPFPRRGKVLQPLHLVQMTKPLRAAEEL